MTTKSNATATPHLSHNDKSRYRRANVILGVVIPIAIAVLAIKGYFLVIFDLTRYIGEILHRPSLAFVYATQFNIFFFALVYTYLLVYLKPNHHSQPPQDPPEEVVNRSVIYECNSDGTPTRCHLGVCNGSYRPIRARHCRDCGSCKDGFDHHCPFMASCITTKETMKPFMCFLVLVLPSIGLATIPLIPLQLQAVQEVVKATWDTPWMRDYWWSRWYSWAGGPVWRYVGAIFLGYRKYRAIASERPLLVPTITKYLTHEGITYAYDESPCPSLARPTLTPLLLLVSALFVFGVAIAMISTIVINCRNGLGAIQVERARRWRATAGRGPDTRMKVWVPLPSDEVEEGGVVVPVDPNLRLFDVGPERNWRIMMGEHWWQWFMPRHRPVVDEFEMSPVAVVQLKEEARKRAG